MFLKCVPAGNLAANCYVLCDEETKKGAVIDPGEYDENVKKAIELSGMRELSYILCTHGHFDHISGVAEMKKQYPDAKIGIGEKDASYLTDSQLSLASQFGFNFTPCSADIEFSEGDAFSVGNINFIVKSAPGHTPGGVLYFIESEKIIFTGDTLFKGSMGRTDLYGGDCFALLRTLLLFKTLPEDYRIYAGHGESSTIGYELKTNMFIR